MTKEEIYIHAQENLNQHYMLPEDWELEAMELYKDQELSDLQAKCDDLSAEHEELIVKTQTWSHEHEVAKSAYLLLKSQNKELKDRYEKLKDAYERYTALLSEELDSAVQSAAVHGWSSNNFEKGRLLREEISLIKTGLID